MKQIFPFLLVCIFLSACNRQPEGLAHNKRTQDFNFDWQFYKTQKDLDLADLDGIQNWESVRLPHDWSITTPYNQAYVVTDSTPNLGYIGWYKKEFVIPKACKGKSINLHFDGVYNNSEVFINGERVVERPYGYSAFDAELNGYINYGEKNTVLVRVDRRAFLDGRWYNGSGIYRDVTLIIKEPIHFKTWGIGITTPKVSEGQADVQLEIDLKNNEASEKLSLEVEIYDNLDSLVPTSEFIIDDIKNDSYTIQLNKPKLWSPAKPNLYQAKCILKDKKGKVWDTELVTFGIRTIEYDVNDGFFLNGVNTQFKGVCLHEDAGALGLAVPDAVWKRRLQLLKDAGVNAIRCAHNPPSNRFLDLCDQLGFLVQDEAFDEWDYPKDKRRNYNASEEDSLTYGYTNSFQEWAEKDLKAMVLRDRNHPSIVMWSIGNEIEWTYPRYGKSSGYFGSDKKYYYDEPPITIAQMKENMQKNPPQEYELAKTAKKLSHWVKEIDTTRPVTANLVIPTISHFSGYTDALDIVGYSYRASVYDYGHRNYPDKMILGTENWANWVEWKSVIDHPFVPGIFLWTGVAYMGETDNVNERGGDMALLDFAGFKTPRWHMFKSVWNEKPEIYATTMPLTESEYKEVNGEAVDIVKNQWRKRRWGYQPYQKHWNYKDNEKIVVEVYTNSKGVELLLNEKSYGVKYLADFEDHIIKWIIPFESGELKVIDVNDSNVFYKIQTAGEPVAIKLLVDRPSIKADAYDVAHVEAQLVDINNTPVTHLDEDITFTIEGPGKLLATDNGSNQQRSCFNTYTCATNEGKVLAYIQSTKGKGQIKVTAKLNNTVVSSAVIDTY